MAPSPNPTQPQRFSFAGANVQIYESLEGKVSIYYANTKLHHGVDNSTGGDIFTLLQQKFFRDVYRERWHIARRATHRLWSLQFAARLCACLEEEE
ncbi:MAG: hypothetical protein ACRD4X_18510 [Candidatus Acidiferrales bacterium]